MASSAAERAEAALAAFTAALRRAGFPNDAVEKNALRSVGRAIEAAVAEERERCAAVARGGAKLIEAHSSTPLKFVTPEKFAVDMAIDIAEAIERGDEPGAD